MINDINYTASINVDWIKFKGQKGVVVKRDETNGVTTFQTFDTIPDNLKIIVSENKGNARSAKIVFKQNDRIIREILISQSSNKEGVFNDGTPYLDKGKTSFFIHKDDNINNIPISGGSVTFSAVYTEVYSINKYETNADGIEIRNWSEVISQSEMDVTNDATWSITPSDLNVQVIIENNKAKISIPNNTSSSNIVFSIQSSYNNLLSNAIMINQNAANA